MKTLIRLLRQQNCEFRINTRRTHSHEVYFVHEKAETVRSTSVTARSVTVYVDHDGFKGDYTFRVYPSDSEETLCEKIQNAILRARLIRNEYYALPAKAKQNVTATSNLASMPMNAVAQKVAQACFDADKGEGGSINALEVFVYCEEVSVVNSNGLEKSQRKWRVMVEAIPTWNEKGESVELYEACNFTELDEKALTAEISRKLAEVRDRYHAQKPASPVNAPVVLFAPELAEVCKELSYSLNYSSVYGKVNLFNVGDDVQKRTSGDGITLTRCAQLKGSRHSAAFDADGSELVDTVIMQNGVAVACYGGNRFAQYLKQPCTGELPCIRLETGTLSQSQAEGIRRLECVSFSGLQTDLNNDYIGGEVRLAYLVEGEKRTPLTGISISGKLSEVLPTIRLSQQQRTYENYCGPAFALLDNVTVF